jgi:hypothetical protein
VKLQKLHENGARRFLIHGTGALGCMPQKLAMPRDDDRGLDANGCVASINNVCKKFNSLLSEACDELRLQLKKSTILFVDMFAIKYDLVANNTKYGEFIRRFIPLIYLRDCIVLPLLVVIVAAVAYPLRVGSFPMYSSLFSIPFFIMHSKGLHYCRMRDTNHNYIVLHQFSLRSNLFSTLTYI